MATQEAYFVPRSEILAWINSTLGLRLTKVEEVRQSSVSQPSTVPAAALPVACPSHLNGTVCVCVSLQTANGAVACQLLDALYPNTVPMKKVQYTQRGAVASRGVHSSRLLT